MNGSLWEHVWRMGVLLVVLVVGAVVTFLSGVGGRPLGWLWAPAVLAAGAAAGAWLLWWRHERRGPALAVAVGIAVIAGAVVAGGSPPGHTSLRNALDDIDTPERAELVDESAGGNVLCFDYCPSLHREYVVPASDTDHVLQQLRQAVQDAGYELQESVDGSDPNAFVTRLAGRSLYLSGRVDPGPGEGVILQLSARSTG